MIFQIDFESDGALPPLPALILPYLRRLRCMRFAGKKVSVTVCVIAVHGEFGFVHRSTCVTLALSDAP